jgi:hypothetical protein
MLLSSLGWSTLFFYLESKGRKFFWNVSIYKIPLVFLLNILWICEIWYSDGSESKDYFWYVLLYSLLHTYHFREKHCLHLWGRVTYSSILRWWFLQYNGAYLQGRKGSYSFTLNMDATHFSETLVPVYRTKKKTVFCIPMIIIFTIISNV